MTSASFCMAAGHSYAYYVIYDSGETKGGITPQKKYITLKFLLSVFIILPTRWHQNLSFVKNVIIVPFFHDTT